MKTIAIYPGSFNPFHIGHLNILQKAQRMFDEVIVAVGINPNKTQSETYIAKNGEVITVKDKPRNEVLSEYLGFTVESYPGYLSEYVKSKSVEGVRVVLVRGLRNGDDLDYEINQLRVIEDMMGKGVLNVVYISCDIEYEHISSTVCRQMELIKKNSSIIYYKENGLKGS